jgi:hypothetical protein
MYASFYKEIERLALSIQSLAKVAIQEYSPLVECIIGHKVQDANKIEHLLDNILGFCFDSEMLQLYKKLCRYYFKLDPETTARYVYAYRDMWDEEYQNKIIEGGKK